WWVDFEYQTFCELGGKERTIFVHVAGDRSDVLPKGVEVEPLVVDVKASTPREQLQLVQKERFRVLAPIIGASYADLLGRHRRIRNITIVSVFAVLLAALFVTAQIANAFRQERDAAREARAIAARSRDEQLARRLSIEASTLVEQDPRQSAVKLLEATTSQ